MSTAESIAGRDESAAQFKSSRPDFFSERGPSASTSKGFLASWFRVTPSSRRFKHDFQDSRHGALAVTVRTGGWGGRAAVRSWRGVVNADTRPIGSEKAEGVSGRKPRSFFRKPRSPLPSVLNSVFACFRCYQSVGPFGNRFRDLCLFSRVHVVGATNHDGLDTTRPTRLALNGGFE